ncbi:hypothetical protein Rhopal_005951-T1 [Rhodotorula paludigena]|uniref:Zn(2)-C6 fungal-type domain-containing protein n=1 Tax=Rhodotorula paludigena TaxID=86838 RepID=A0AAV5GSJ1_9BASI|nr:hypothetical protein Rhopal_005951-T1 [Rhodotorula paludigena]
MPKAQSSYYSTGLGTQARHLSCEGCRKRKLKCSRTSPCAACELRGAECIWLDCKPSQGFINGSHDDNMAEIERLHKIIKQLQQMLIERDGQPYYPPVPPPTPPYGHLDPLPSPGYHHTPRVYHVGPSPTQFLPPPHPYGVGATWVSPTRSFSNPSPSTLFPSYTYRSSPHSAGVYGPPSARAPYDSTVSYALPQPPPSLAGSHASPVGHAYRSNQGSYAYSGEGWAPPPPPSNVASLQPSNALLLDPSTTSTANSFGGGFRPSPADLPPINTSMHYAPTNGGPSAVTALLNEAYAHVSEHNVPSLELEAMSTNADGSTLPAEGELEAHKEEWETLMHLPDDHA